MFRTTRWSIVVGAKTDSEDGRAALDTLCRIYRSPVVAYLRARGHAPGDSEDLAQAFFERLLSRRGHAAADPERGRFRAFLLTALKRFVANEYEREHAHKRGGGRVAISLDEETDLHDPHASSPEETFERDYALTVIARALEQLRAEAVEAGKSDLFDEVCGFLLEPPDTAEYAALAERLGMRRNTLTVAIHRLRNRLRERVREVLLDTVDSDAALEVEVSMLRNALASRQQGEPHA